ncbi:glutamate 5-kinase [Oceanobacillus piezotolerans]|uniref:Glutamate 5-kinase n=1 Tax=Oceanobacillus piezotolerans TaxID=2448030 RepID=A0A498DB05_9BACI|nr:glutamate 5-kinase [Oceanobacillus piezotolerans]RLL44923.1 glutamate 5-kinase [Oceanobacillus piezotolerans]
MAKERIVVKIGSSSLTNEKGEIDEEKLTEHVQAMAALREANHEVVLVSSGAVAAGFRLLGYSSRPVTLKGKQAAAAIGQSLLIQRYMDKFQAYDLKVALLLLTRSDFSSQARYRNAFATISELLERGIIPIINENDTVAVDELTFGDNDMLSALVSGFVHADRLIILTDINGIYDSNPRKNPQAQRYDFIEEVSAAMIEGTDESGSKVGTGGMRSKLLAANTAISLGVPVFIGKGNGEKKLLEVLEEKGDGTYLGRFRQHGLNTRKQWIALHSDIHGRIYVDNGAEEAILYRGKSLLSPGITKVEGTFQAGDVVEVIGAGEILGKGEVNCSSAVLMEVLQTHKPVTSQEVIHRNNWVTLKKEGEKKK